MEKSIGIFDSGLGGLTSVKELINILPNENIIYFGDTGRVPYGSRSDEIIKKYALEDLRFLLSFDVKLIIVACGTVSSVALETLKKFTSVPIIGVVEPAAQKAVSCTKNKKVGIIGTESTIKSGSYKEKINLYDSSIDTYEKACPLFVPLVENGHLDTEITKIVANEYLLPLKEKEIDTLILGCTHYPLLTNVISDIMNDKVTLINPGLESSKFAAKLLAENDMLNKGFGGDIKYFVSDDTDKFSYLASVFLGSKINSKVEKIDIGEW